MTDKEAVPPPDRWAASIKATRDAATWVATSLAVVAAAIFGGIPALKGLNFKWGDPSDNWQTGWAIASAIVGLGSIIVVILKTTRAILPIYVTLSSVSRPTRITIEKSPGDYLPPRIGSISELQTKLTNYEALIPLLMKQASDAPATAAKDAKAALAEGISQRDNLREWAAAIRQLDVFNQTQARLNNPSLWIAVAAATVGAVSFMFITSAPADPAEAPEEASVGQVAVLTPRDTVAWSRVTGANDLTGCVADDGTYLVLVRDFTDSVYSVELLPFAASCQPFQVDVRTEVATVSVLLTPPKITVEYTPAPTPTGKT